MRSANRQAVLRRSFVSVIEPLEMRQLLTSIVVNTTSDAVNPPGGATSLREAIALADASGANVSITFSPSVFSSSKTITLSQGVIEMKAKHTITLTGPSAHLSISGNGSDSNGGIFAVDSGSAAFNINNVTLTKGNAFAVADDFYGGAIYDNGASMTLSNVTMTNNAADYGGAIANAGGNVTLKNCSITGNHAGSFAGAIYNTGTLSLNNTTVSGNTASEEAGAIQNFLQANMTITDSTISGNAAQSGGACGGIENDGTMTMTNDTVAKNTAEQAAGIENIGTLTMKNVTVSGNTANTFGGGIYNTKKITLGNCIIAGNTDSQSSPDVNGTVISDGHNLIGKTNGSNGWISSDLKGTIANPLNAKLGSLGNNGGPTQTMRPQTGSPAIDAGSNSLIPAGITTDQRGLSRIAGSKVDIGAVEVQAISISGEVFNDANASGTLDSSESGLNNVRVYVDLHNTGSFTSSDPNAFTDSSGKYTISGVQEGTAVVLRQVLPSGYRQTLPNNGAAAQFTAGTSSVTKENFGDTQKVRLSGFAYADLNHDGVRQSNEPFLSGVTVYLDKNGNKKLDSGEPSTTTDSNGFWIIGDLSAGTYTARFDAKGNYASYLQTQPANGGGQKVTLSNGQVGDNLLFGIYKPASVTFNSEKRQISANTDETTKTSTNTTTGTFNKTESVLFSDGSAKSSITSNISSSGISASGTLAANQGEDLDFASSDIDVKFTLGLTTAYSLNYNITGNNFSFELKKVGGSDIIGPNGPSNNPSVFNYSFCKSGSLAAGQYELIFTAFNTSSNPFETTAYTMNFAI